MDVRRKFFYSKEGKALEQVAQRVVGSPSLETCKVRMERALSNLIKLFMALHAL